MTADGHAPHHFQIGHPVQILILMQLRQGFMHNAACGRVVACAQDFGFSLSPPCAF
jgi:hypothetical protein